MSDPFIAEIRIFAGNFAPRGWAFCQGQLLPISQNTALFSLLGTAYGGDGRTTCGLPNLQNRAPMHPGNGPGLTSRRLGEITGNETITLTEAQSPSHNHTLNINDGVYGDSNLPSGNVFAKSAVPTASEYSTIVPTIKGGELSNIGESQPHNNVQPSLGLFYIIALVGIYPSR